MAEELVVQQPYDGMEIERIALAPWTRADSWLERAVALHRNLEHKLPAFKRIEILRRVAGLLEKQRDAFALLIAREGGKPLADARVEAERAVNGIELAIEEISGLSGTEIPMDLTSAGAGRIAFTRREPIGPVVAVSAFNHPLNLIVHQVVPAIATGCPVIVKPADTTPLCCLRFIDLVHEAGLPEDWCQAFVCDVPTAERLVTDSRVAFFTFIGSAKVGWYLRSKLAPGTRCALEHGGAAPVIIAADADLDAAIPALVKGGYYHAGQVCVSVQRIFVDEAIKDRFVEQFTSAVAALNTGDPTDAATEVGPLILPREVDRVANWVNDAVAGGARVSTGGQKRGERAYQPTVLIEPPPTANVSTLEIFGPVTCIYGYSNLDEAIERANALPLAFQSAIFTSDISRAFNAAERLAAGAVMINDHTAYRVDWMPFGGQRTSGLSVGGIGHTMHDMTQEKLIVLRHQ
jgi:acyl-CoA reductase-like NAD-dependent aldehyde dehydrogenase